MSEIDPFEEFLANEAKQFDAMLKSLDEFTFDEKEFDFSILELPELPAIPDIPELKRSLKRAEQRGNAKRQEIRGKSTPNLSSP